MAQNITYKTRLVAHDDKKVEGLDYHEIFVPVVRWTTLRTLVSMAAQLDDPSPRSQISLPQRHFEGRYIFGLTSKLRYNWQKNKSLQVASFFLRTSAISTRME